MKWWFAITPPGWAAIFLLAALSLHLGWPPSRVLDISCWPCAAALFAAGSALPLWGGLEFRRSRTPIRPADRPSSLVITGPYRFTRNPMYLGVCLVLGGAGMLAGSLPMLLVPFAFAAIVSGVFIPFEERRLAGEFGDAYRAYCSRVRRWI